MTSKTGSVSKPRLKEIDTKDNSRKARDMAKARYNLVMAVNMMVIFITMSYRDKEPCDGVMVRPTKATGLGQRCMDQEY